MGPGRPYLIAQGKDGYCTHFEHGSCSCTVRENRPVPCRGYDCRNDKRIWLDFENKIPNPNIERADWPQCETSAVEKAIAGELVPLPAPEGGSKRELEAMGPA